ncbi:MAG: hypothetical protein HXX13_14970 [Bacteroidetes bacterium]|nr:hypothetical protein [Bacteroidota bacterium]
MSLFRTILKSVFNEILIVFLFIYLINNFLGNVEQRINSDAKGYYDYLPSIFIFHDFVRHNTTRELNPEKFKRIDKFGVYNDYGKQRVDQYTCGTAVLESPFFLAAWKLNEDVGEAGYGYNKPFQHCVFFAALFYLFLALFFFKKLSQSYNIRRSTIIISQLLLVFATGVTHYTNEDAGFSHVFSLFAITAFLYFVRIYFQEKKYSSYLWACALLGLIVLLRPVNGIIIFFVPFLAGSFREFWKAIAYLFKKPVKAGSGFLIFLLICSIQCLAWYLQVGEFLVNSYTHTKFNFLKPEWVNVLFSYRKGLLIYAPVLSLGILSLIWFAFKKRYTELFVWIGFFIILTYIISSWEIWYYGCSYGMRPYIDFYALFFLPFALMFDSSKLVFKVVMVLAGFFFIYVNMIQTYQYQNYIIKWMGMEKQDYWNVFLKTDNRYKGVVWKEYPGFQYYKKNFSKNFGDFRISENRDSTIIDIHTRHDTVDIAKVSVVQLRFINDFNIDNDTKITMLIKDVESGNSVCFVQIYMLRFLEKGWNQLQEGLFNYKLGKNLENKDYEIKVRVSAAISKADLQSVNISLYSKL